MTWTKAMGCHGAWAVDFDGVLHRPPRAYPEQGSREEQLAWYRELAEEPIEGALEGMDRIRRVTSRIYIFTCRANPKAVLCNGAGTLNEMSIVLANDVAVWLRRHGIQFDQVTGRKPHADVYLDDCGYRFVCWDGVYRTLDAVEKLGVGL